ncbi:WD40-repeat-containing domain protein [Phycomyces nitens]|nr:WD40-repeat-containing domain protein [Phycomyces nitens]
MASLGEDHNTVLRFLVHHGYKDTAEAFKREAAGFINLKSSTQTLVNEEQLTQDLARLTIERALEVEDGDENYFNTLCCPFDSVHQDNILAAIIVPDSNTIISSSTDKTVVVSPDLLGSNTSDPRSYKHHAAPVLSIDTHPLHPNVMLTTSMDGTAALVDTLQPMDILDPEGSGLIQLFKNHSKYVTRGIFSPEHGKYIATASYDKYVCVYEADQDSTSAPTYTLIKKLGPFVGNAETICFLGPDVLVIGVRDDNYLHYIHLPDFSREKYNMNANGDNWVSFSPVWLSPSPDRRFLLCSTDHESGRMILFAAHQSKQIQNYYDSPSDNKFATRRHGWHPSGKYFYTIGGDDNNVRVVETKTGRVVESLKSHKKMIKSIFVDPEQGVITAGFDHLINVWSTPLHNADKGAGR